MNKKILGIVFCLLLIVLNFTPIINGTFFDIDIKLENRVDIVITNTLIDPPEVEWMEIIGTEQNYEGCHSVQQTIDGGYILGGSKSDLTTSTTYFWLVKTYATGNVEWEQTYNDGNYCRGACAKQTSEGDYFMCGTKIPSYGDDKQGWLIKTNSNGVMLWNKSYRNDNISLGPTWVGVDDMVAFDAEVKLCGKADEPGVENDRGFIITIDSNGNEQCQEYICCGEFNCIEITDDFGLVVVGMTADQGIWLGKFNSNCTSEWFKELTSLGTGYHVEQTEDGGFIVTGRVYNGNNYDICLIKTNSNGIEEWAKIYGDLPNEVGYSVNQISDGGYILCGETESNGNVDIWVIRTDSLGNIVWDEKYGGDGIDIGLSIQQTSDGGFIIGGTSDSYSTYLDAPDAILIKLEREDFLNLPPTIPSINGTSSGIPGEEYDFIFSSVDPNEDTIQFYIDWGDETSDTTDFYPSGEDVIVSHIWTEKGIYTIQVKAIDQWDAESDWAILEVSMPKNKAISTPLFLQRFFQHFPFFEKILKSYNNGLVGYWTFDENTFGTTPDISGNGNDGLIYGATWISGLVETSLFFDDYGEKVVIDDSPSLRFDNTDEFTLSVWVKLDPNIDNNVQIILDKGTDSAHEEGYCLRTGPGHEFRCCFMVGDGDNRYQIWSTSKLVDWGWHHIVGVWDNGEMRIYLDGNLENQTNYNIEIKYTDTPLFFGNNYWNDHELYGRLDEARIYERILSRNEIKDLFHAPFKNYLIIGPINSVNREPDNIISFRAENLVIFDFSKFRFIRYSSDEEIMVLKPYLGILNINYAIGLFRAII